METLIFATNNQHKVNEIKNLIGNRFRVLSLKEAGILVDIPEPFNTIEENAWTKANTIYKLTGQNCFADDTGLEVEALNGEPGVKSARYAGEGKSASDNIALLLAKMKGKVNRQARFKTVISLILNGAEHRFEGICNGVITSEIKGDAGFGYDPVFLPEGASKSFGQMPLNEKNLYSHREKATAQLISFLSRHGK